MEDGARRRGGPEKASEKTEEGGEGVALKKEIGLLSACGIIVGEWRWAWGGVSGRRGEVFCLPPPHLLALNWTKVIS